MMMRIKKQKKIKIKKLKQIKKTLTVKMEVIMKRKNKN